MGLHSRITFRTSSPGRHRAVGPERHRSRTQARQLQQRRRVNRSLWTATVAAATVVAGSFLLSPQLLDPSGPGALTPVAGYSVGPNNVTDRYDRVVTDGLGRAPLGGAWTSTAGAFEVGSGVARLDGLAAGRSARATVTGLAVADEQLRTTFALDALPTGRGVYLALETRRQADGDAYRTRVFVAPDGALKLDIVQVTGGVERRVSDTVIRDVALQAHQTMTVETSVAGSDATELKARVWTENEATPDWQLSTTQRDSDRIAGAGNVGLWFYASASNPSPGIAIDDTQGWELQPTSSSPDPAPAAVPGPTNTGVPAGTKLTVLTGDLRITTPGATYSGLDIRGFVIVEAGNVTIRNSIVRGGRATGNIGLVNAGAEATGFRIIDSELAPQYPSVWIDGLKGWNYSAIRVNIHDTVDGAKVYGSNASISHSWIHGARQFSSDPNQGGGPSHNDGVQIGGGTNISITDNTIVDAGNAALQVTQGNGSVQSLTFAGNQVGGGACTLNLSSKPLGSMGTVTLTSNRFLRTSAYKCAMIIDSQLKYASSDNRYLDDGKLVGVVSR